MTKIGLAITYITIMQQSSMIFNKKYPYNLKEASITKNKGTKYLNFVFNDFLESYFGINLQ